MEKMKERSSESHPSSLEDGRVVTDEGKANKGLPQPITKEEYIGQMKMYFPQLKRWCKTLTVNDDEAIKNPKGRFMQCGYKFNRWYDSQLFVILRSKTARLGGASTIQASLIAFGLHEPCNVK